MFPIMSIDHPKFPLLYPPPRGVRCDIHIKSLGPKKI